MIVAISVISVLVLAPAVSVHTGTACANVLAKNPQAGPGSHSAPPAQENFFAVGATFCGIS